MLTAKLGHRHTAFSLPQDRDDLRLSVSACPNSKSPRSSCRENSTLAAPYFRGDYPFKSRRLLEPIGNIPPAEAEKAFYENLNSLDIVA
jgi:hypothetical protein